MKNKIALGVALLSCTLATTNIFGSQKRQLSMRDQLFGCKRIKRYQQKELVQGQMFHRFTLLPKDLQNNIAQNACLNDWKSLMLTNKRLFCFMTTCCNKYFDEANLYMEKLENIFDPQKNYYYGGTAPADVRTKMSQALYNHRIARESHARGDLVGAVFLVSNYYV